jgi:hypothetical protein
MITKTLETGMISILADGQLQVREDTVIIEDEVELSRTYFRTTYAPTTDIETITNPKVKAVAKLVWTPKVIQTYKDKIASSPMFPGL